MTRHSGKRPARSADKGPFKTVVYIMVSRNRRDTRRNRQTKPAPARACPAHEHAGFSRPSARSARAMGGRAMRWIVVGGDPARPPRLPASTETGGNILFTARL